MADSTYGEESDNPFAGAHDGDDDEVCHAPVPRHPPKILARTPPRRIYPLLPSSRDTTSLVQRLAHCQLGNPSPSDLPCN
jgi:hypothetical protein